MSTRQAAPPESPTRSWSDYPGLILGSLKSLVLEHHEKSEKKRPANLPRPLAAPKTLRYYGQLILNLIWSVICGHVIRWDYILIYVLILQNDGVRPGWNSLLNGLIGVTIWKVLRHFARAGMESQLTSATIWIILANPFSLLREKKPVHGFKKIIRSIFEPSWLLTFLEFLRIPTPRAYREYYKDNGELMKLHWWQWLYMVPALIISGSFGYAMGVGLYFLVEFIGHRFGVHPTYNYQKYPAFAKQDIDVFGQDWMYSVSGLLGTIFYARLVFKVYALELLRSFARQLAAVHQFFNRHGHKWTAWLLIPRFPLPAGFRAAFHKENEDEQPIHVWTILLLGAIMSFALAAAPFGYIVITKVATHEMVVNLPWFHLS